MDCSTSRTGLEIAIIGMFGRFVRAKNIEQFWTNLQNGVESVEIFSDRELEDLGIERELFSRSNYVKTGGIFEDLDLFDASFFGFNPREAEMMDPQHRIFLECAWEALENSGYNSDAHKNQIGVFAGSSINSYLPNILSNPEILSSAADFQISIANDPDFLATRVSYKLNLSGPSYTVQTTCSTSLVAVHLACQSLLSGECDIALAGGISVSKKVGYLYQEGGIYSPDGHCRAFDAKANGTMKGKGVGIVVLKRLEEAIADGDCIHAVIKGSAINNDGSSKVSYTAPSIDGQAKVIKAALDMAEVEPETITYIEAHGTGTSLGDPIEIAALTQVFRSNTQKNGFCAIGSVKTNIGHLGPAAGVASLIKTVLALKHKQIPPSLHFEEPNPQIDFANSPFYVNSTLSEWKTNGTPRRAGVSSFGFGGTNAHVILEEAPTVESSFPSRKTQLLLLSAKTSTALETATATLAQYLQQHPDLNIADVAHTLQVGRRAFDHRRMVVCHDLDDAVQALSTLDPQRVKTHHLEVGNRPVVFMFPGQGAQYVNMARELYETEPTFALQVDRCCELLKPHLGLDLLPVLYPSDPLAEIAAQQLKQTAITQAALFVIEYALAELWMSWGVRPFSAIGHSIGEYVAATIAGVFSLEDALAIVATRGQLMQQLKSGAMLSIQLSEPEVQQELGEQLSLAAINAPNSCVVSGTHEAIEALHKQLEEKGIASRKLHTSHAFHSPAMQPIVEPFTQLLRKVKLNPPKIQFISNVTGTWITPQQATDPNYWAQHLLKPVRFSSGLVELCSQPKRILLEVGPGRTLSTLAIQHQIAQSVVYTSLRHPQEQQSDVAFLLDTLGKLWLSGVTIDWSGFYAHEQRHRIPLPTYPFERQRYWIEPKPSKAKATAPTALLEKKSNIADWFYIPVWKQSAPIDRFKREILKEQKSCWLIFVDGYGFGEQIASRLKGENQDVITVSVGEKFTRVSASTYAINPQARDDYNALIQALRDRNFTPQTIAHFWSISPDEQTRSASLFFEDCQHKGFYSLLFLTQALAKQNITDPLKLMVVTSNVHEVTGDEKLSPQKATVLGPCKVIPQEYPNITCCCFDVIIPESGNLPSQKLIDRLIAELTAKPTDLVVAYRGKHRWIQTFDPVRLDAAIEGKIKLRQGGVYLITGGLGGIGLVLAEHLAQKVQAKLILIGREGLPERNQWEEWLATHDERDKVSRKIEKVRAIEKLGASVLVVSADVADEKQMHSAIAQAFDRFGEIHGVIHAAGEVKNATRIIQEISHAECQLQFHPKVHGLFVLEKVLQGKNLDFCLFLSSLASVLGGLGYIAYSAANIFMDAFAHKHNQTNSFPWISVNWDNWRLQSEKDNATANLLNFFMTPSEGVEAFERALSMGEVAQVVVSTGDLQARIDQWIKLESLRNTESSHKEGLASHHQRPNLHTTYVAPRNEVEQTVANIWQEILGLEQIGIHDNFFDLGGHSLLATQVISHLRKAFQVELPVRHLFENPTVAEQALAITQSQNEEKTNTIKAIPRIDRVNADELLAEIAEMSDQQVELLLRKMLDKEKMKK